MSQARATAAGESAGSSAGSRKATRGPSSRTQRRAESRRRILDSAKEVFFRDGFMAANLDEVAEKAGVAKGTLYRYFDNKADLYVGVLADDGAAFLERMRQTAASSGTASERLERLAHFYFDHWMKHQEYFQIFWAIDNQSVIGTLPAGVVDEVGRLWESCVRIVHEVVEEGIRSGEFVDCDSWGVANFLWTAANAVIQSDASDTRREIRRGSLEHAYELGVRLVFKGLEPGTA